MYTLGLCRVAAVISGYRFLNFVLSDTGRKVFGRRKAIGLTHVLQYWNHCATFVDHEGTPSVESASRRRRHGARRLTFQWDYLMPLTWVWYRDCFN